MFWNGGYSGGAEVAVLTAHGNVPAFTLAISVANRCLAVVWGSEQVNTPHSQHFNNTVFQFYFFNSCFVVSKIVKTVHVSIDFKIVQSRVNHVFISMCQMCHHVSKPVFSIWRCAQCCVLLLVSEVKVIV